MFSGLALARDVANMMRFDESAIVVCREADDSWGFPADRSLVIPQMRIFGRMKGRKYIPRAITTPFFRHIFKPFLAALKSGDIVWVHNQPFWSAALAPLIRAKVAGWFIMRIIRLPIDRIAQRLGFLLPMPRSS